MHKKIILSIFDKKMSVCHHDVITLVP